MSKTVVINFGSGDLNNGLPHITARLWTDQHPHAEQIVGSLPAAPELIQFYRLWQSTYAALCDRVVLRSPAFEANEELEIDGSGITQVSQWSFQELSHQFQQEMNSWLQSAEFLNIERQLRSQLSPTDEVRVIFEANHELLRRLPWQCWDLFRDYPKAEMALSLLEYKRPVASRPPFLRKKVRVLAILASCQGIDVEAERQFLLGLPQAEVKFLIMPSRQEFNHQLWDPAGWDMLFFAGHSQTEGNTGRIYINQNPHGNSLTIEQLEAALSTVIDNGLKLAIFNSCDGLGLAQALGRLQIPQVVVMREPVPNRVAQEFLRYFLEGFATQHLSLYLAVRQARRKLQGLEDEFPGASWLPVICQNPAEVPSHWQEWFQPRSLKLRRPTLREFQILLLSSLVSTGVVTAVRSLGFLQPMELSTFDALMRLRPQEDQDSRILIVTVTEQDIQAQGNEFRRGSLADRTLDRLLEKLENYQPIAIGLDIYRDYPATLPTLAKRMQQSDRLISICKSSDLRDDPSGVAPPPEIPAIRQSFSDVVEDDDGVLRRHLLTMAPDPVSPCRSTEALNVELAFRYLRTRGISAALTPDNNLKLGQQVYPRLAPQTGGYQSVDARGTQILLNYRALASPQDIAQRVTVAEVLAGQVPPEAIRGRIVLIGVVANTRGDYWSTPYGSAFAKQVPGIFLQAQMVSQLLSAALDQRSLLWVWPTWGEVVWIWGWAFGGGVLAWYFRRAVDRAIAGGVALGVLSGYCMILLVGGGWIPLVPCVLVLGLTGGWVALIISQPRK